MEKMDARKRYTQMVLKQSFLKLLKEKPVNRITVKEVCALAQLNRATFYAHYSDCFALMESIENELIDTFENSLRYVNSLDVTALIEAIYDMVDQNQAACRILILGNTNATVLMRMIALAKADSIRLPAVLVVMAATMTVGLCLLPTSFCMITTGRRPSCSEPTPRPRSA